MPLEGPTPGVALRNITYIKRWFASQFNAIDTIKWVVYCAILSAFGSWSTHKFGRWTGLFWLGGFAALLAVSLYALTYFLHVVLPFPKPLFPTCPTPVNPCFGELDYHSVETDEGNSALVCRCGFYFLVRPTENIQLIRSESKEWVVYARWFRNRGWVRTTRSDEGIRDEAVMPRA
jgi:hypothetical protein